MPSTFINASCALSGSPLPRREHLANERKKNDYVSRNGIHTEASAESGSHLLCIAPSEFMPDSNDIIRASRFANQFKSSNTKLFLQFVLAFPCCERSEAIRITCRTQHRRMSQPQIPVDVSASLGPAFCLSNGIAMNERKRNEVKWSPLASTKKCDSFGGSGERACDRTRRTTEMRAARRKVSVRARICFFGWQILNCCKTIKGYVSCLSIIKYYSLEPN